MISLLSFTSSGVYSHKELHIKHWCVTRSAYVEFMKREAAEHALSLDGTSFMSRILKVISKRCLYCNYKHLWFLFIIICIRQQTHVSFGYFGYFAISIEFNSLAHTSFFWRFYGSFSIEWIIVSIASRMVRICLLRPCTCYPCVLGMVLCSQCLLKVETLYIVYAFNCLPDCCMVWVSSQFMDFTSSVSTGWPGNFTSILV